MQRPSSSPLDRLRRAIDRHDGVPDPADPATFMARIDSTVELLSAFAAAITAAPCEGLTHG